jgi:hypothetical protein
MLARLVAPVALAALLGCDASGNGYRQTGPGLDLYSNETPAATRNLSLYFNQLCAQAGMAAMLDGQPTCQGGFDANEYRLLVQTAFNDIDLRCDRYLAWIDNKRAERLAVSGGLNAVQTLLGGVMGVAGASSDSLTYLTLAFGFANSIYDVSNTSTLMALEPSTVKTIVYERRLAFRRAASEAPITNRPAAVYAMRNYLAICTPQTIVLDVNTFSRAALGGEGVDLDARAREQFDTLPGGAPLTAQAPAIVDNGLVPPPAALCPGCPAFFVEPGRRSTADLLAGQTGLCVAPDGRVGRETEDAIAIFEETILVGDPSGLDFQADGLVSDDEFVKLREQGCRNGEREVFRNYFEATQYRVDDNREVLIGDLNRLYPNRPQLSLDTPLTDETLRGRIGDAARALVAADELTAAPPEGQMTFKLDQAIGLRGAPLE